MPFCRNCGTQVDQNQDVCLSCGFFQNNINKAVQNPDTGGIAWGLIGFFVPIAGLILYLIWKDERPNSAKAAGIGALVSVSMGILYIFVMIAFALAML